jgi:hypothetical protein
LRRYQDLIGRKSAAVHAIYQLELMHFCPNQRAIWHQSTFLEPLDAWLNNAEEASGFRKVGRMAQVKNFTP